MKENEHIDEEITLKDIFQVIHEYWKELWNYWFLVPLFCIPTVSWYMYKHFTHKVEYTTQIKFIVESGSGGAGMLNGILGSFGLGGTEKGFGPRKIAEVVKSKLNVINVMLDTSENREILANQILDVYNYSSEWSEKKTVWKDFQFKHYRLNDLDTMEVSAAMKLYGKIIGSINNRNPFITYSFDEDTDIMRLSAKTENPELSKRLVSTFFKVTKNFFEVKIFEDQIKSKNLLKAKKDSLEAYVEAKEYELARFESANRGLINQVAIVPKNKLQREFTVATLALGEVIKSYEVSDYQLKSMKPYFFILDRPVGPIAGVYSSIFIRLIIGLILGGMFYATFIVGRKVIRDNFQ